MALVFTNFASGVLAANITNAQTTVSIELGQGGVFPVINAGDYAIAVLEDAAGNKEVVHITARSADTLTVERAKEGTSARAYSIGDRIEVRPTSGFMREFIDAGDY